MLKILKSLWSKYMLYAWRIELVQESDTSTWLISISTNAKKILRWPEQEERWWLADCRYILKVAKEFAKSIKFEIILILNYS